MQKKNQDVKTPPDRTKHPQVGQNPLWDKTHQMKPEKPHRQPRLTHSGENMLFSFPLYRKYFVVLDRAK